MCKLLLILQSAKEIRLKNKTVAKINKYFNLIKLIIAHKRTYQQIKLKNTSVLIKKVYNYNVIKIFLFKNRKIILIATVVLFLVVIVLAKTTNIFKNIETYGGSGKGDGLVYEDITVKDLVNKDTDGDGIPDWQEGLYGLDPAKKETTSGTPDSVAMNKKKLEQGLNLDINNKSTAQINSEESTQTSQFSRELFATITAASQNGSMDQTMVDSLSSNLADKIVNPVTRKVFLISDLKVRKDDTMQAFTNYSRDFNNIFNKYTASNNVLDILQKFLGDGNDTNENALLELDPIIQQINKTISTLTTISIPQSISELHLNFLNSLVLEGSLLRHNQHFLKSLFL